jgi:DNA-binding NarL/FixJ family response regulator
MERRPRVLVGHGLGATRLGIRLALEQYGLVVCAESTHREDTIAAAVRTRPDVSLIDARLPGGATETVRAMLARLPGAAVVVFGDVRDRAGFLDALRAGACGYLSEAVAGEALARTLLAVSLGEIGIPRVLVAALLDEVREGHAVHTVIVPGRGRVELSRRQAQVVSLASEGRSTADIAASLAIDAVTVRRHLASVMRKVGAPTRQAALAVIASALERSAG